MRNYAALSFTEYETLIGDLFGAHLGVRFERFGPGRDGGIDLRHLIDGAGPDVIQVKHFLGSSWSDLKATAKAEKQRLIALDPAPGTYRFVTSQSLTPARKGALTSILSPYIPREDDVFGGEEVDDLLSDHPEVERRHVKLWLASAAALRAIVQAGTHTRSRQLVADIQRKLPLWVQSDAFDVAAQRLAEHHVVVISGQPGIGKTMLAEILVADAIRRGYETIEVSADIDEAWSAYDPSLRQIFLYDDFLGQTSLVELSKNEDSRLVKFMRTVAESETTRFVLTTREYILQRGLQVSERLRHHELEANRVLLALPSYSPLDRALILANHVWHSGALPPAVRMELATAQGYRRIIDHPNYNPRLVEFITGPHAGGALEVNGSRSWLDAAVAALDHPGEIWRAAYEHQLGDVERGPVLALATFGRLAQLEDLRTAHDAWCRAAGVPVSPRRFERALQVVDDSFVATRMEEGEHVVRFTNPGVRDFIERQLRENPGAFAPVLESVAFFGQLQALWPLLSDDRDSRHRARFVDAVVAAADRVIEGPSSVWIPHESWTGERSLKRYAIRPDRRLITMLEIAAQPDAPAQMPEWLSTRLTARTEKWRQASGYADDAVALAQRLVRQPIVALPPTWQKEMKLLVTHDPGGPDEWRQVIELRSITPDLFPADEWEDLSDQFLRSAESFLVDNADNLDTGDDIEAMSVIAEEFGVELDPGWVEHAKDEVARKLAIIDERDDMEFQQWREEGRPRAADETADIDGLFNRLAES